MANPTEEYIKQFSCPKDYTPEFKKGNRGIWKQGIIYCKKEDKSELPQ